VPTADGVREPQNRRVVIALGDPRPAVSQVGIGRVQGPGVLLQGLERQVSAVPPGPRFGRKRRAAPIFNASKAATPKPSPCSRRA